MTIHAKEKQKEYQLRLYIAGRTMRAIRAFENLKKICEEHIDNRYNIEIIDVIKNPNLAKTDQIVALPTLVRRLPPPMRKIIGDLSNTERVLVGLDIHECKQSQGLERKIRANKKE